MSKKKPSKIVKQQSFSASFSGPLPPPNLLGKYNEILPGLADRIVKMAENQTGHRINIETKVIDSNIRMQTLGWVSASVFGLAVVGIAGYLIYIGRSIEGFSSLIGTLAWYGWLYKSGKKKQEQDLARKRDNL